jgi:hypothetical protein
MLWWDYKLALPTYNINNTRRLVSLSSTVAGTPCFSTLNIKCMAGSGQNL